MLYKWFAIGLGVKRWLALLLVGISLVAVGLAYVMIQIEMQILESSFAWWQIALTLIVGLIIASYSLIKLSHTLLAPYRRHQPGRIIDVVHTHSKRQRGIKVVTIGGGTGLPSVLRGMKPYTSNLTAVVTVADDGGSSGRLRREMGVIPPGDLRNNIAALADDESLMTQLFQYRFGTGDLDGHSFGNLFIAALAGVSGGVENALPEVERILNIQGRVLPATLEDVNLMARVRMTGKTQSLNIRGESRISNFGGHIERVSLSPPDVAAYGESAQAILDADLIVIGPGSLYTSILPNLLVNGIADALRYTNAHKVYICNVATQPGETEQYNVADHILALERHIGRGVFQYVLANNARPKENAGLNTHYVDLVPDAHEVLQRYTLIYTDLTDSERPWRHDPQKLATVLMKLYDADKIGSSALATDPIFRTT
mgnify:CR=1 FL=1